MYACPICGKDNPSGFDFCGFCRAPMAEAAGHAEERKLVTMLFADLAGSTELGSRLDPERLRDLLQTYFSAMAAAIDSWGGTVEKYIGDAVLAVFGVPALREDDAERAVRAGMEMLERLEVLNRDFGERHGVTLRVRIGVNTGEVIVPAWPVTERIVTGDAVNVAARLEQAATPDTILVGHRTFLATRGAIRFEGPISLDLKGKAEIVQGYRVIGPEPGMEGTRGPSELWSEMVGREREMDSLLASLQMSMQTRRPHLAVVAGPAGIGKSRLLREFVEQARAVHPELSIYRGRCLAAGRGITYWALGEILRSAFGIALDDSSAVAHDKLSKGVVESLEWLDLPEEEVVRTTFALATTAGFALVDNPLDRMEPQEVAEQLGRAWPRLVTAFAVRGPLVLVCEDLHWADDQLVEMLERLATRSHGPVLVIATARPEFGLDHFGSAGSNRATSISLGPLTTEQGEELVGRLLSEAPLQPSLRADIIEKGDGNPFFIEEMVRHLVDEGALVWDRGRWRATRGQRATRLPDTVHALLASRIDSLPPEEKRVLQEASVVGRTFWEAPVTRAVGDGPIEAALNALERKGFVQPRPTSSFAGQAEFRFKHALISDVAYLSLPKARRARAHAEHAEWVVGLAGDRQEEFAELIAHHLSTAVSDEPDLAWYDQPETRRAIELRAFDALLVAGRVARRKHALRRAVELHARAIPLAPTEIARATALEALGDDHNAAVHGDDALLAYGEAISILRGALGADQERSRLCMKAARMIMEKSGAFSLRQDPALIDELVVEGMACPSEEEVSLWLRALWGAAAVWWLYAGVDSISLDERIDSLTDVLDSEEVTPFPELAAFAQEYLCELHMIRGSYAEVVEITRRTVTLDRIGSAPERALCLIETGIWTLQVAGEADRALEMGMRSYELARNLSPHELMHATGFLITVLYQMGRWSELDGFLDEHVAAFMEEPEATCEMLAGGVLAGATSLAHRGDLRRAGELEATAPPFVSADPLWAGHSDAWRARLQVAAGDAREGRRQAETTLGAVPPWRGFHAALVLIEALVTLEVSAVLSEFLPTARAMAGGMVVLSPTCDRAQASVASASGDDSGARRLLAQAIDGFVRLDVPFEAARTRESLASLSSRDAVRELLERALETYDALGAAPDAHRVRAVLG